MIFVTVGTDNHDFSRLVEKMDYIASRERVIMQIGHSSFIPRNSKWFRFERNSVIEGLYKKADVIVSHAGAGSIINSLKNGKIPIVVPRLKRLGEHVDDHQLDLGRGLAKKGKVVLVEDVDYLGQAIKAKKMPYRRDKALVKNMEICLNEYEEISGR